jgi:hypothetical protein
MGVFLIKHLVPKDGVATSRSEFAGRNDQGGKCRLCARARKPRAVTSVSTNLVEHRTVESPNSEMWQPAKAFRCVHEFANNACDLLNIEASPSQFVRGEWFRSLALK